jgi:hypothetical protein
MKKTATSLRLLLLATLGAAALLPVTPALALCVSRPDNAASHYVENGTAQTLCLQEEVGDTTDRMQLEGRLRALQSEIAIQAQRQRLMATPAPSFGTPQAAW